MSSTTTEGRHRRTPLAVTTKGRLISAAWHLEGTAGPWRPACQAEQVAEKPTLVADAVKAALMDMSFHNLGLVEYLCREGFQQGMLQTDKDERGLLMKSVHKRHDCVHGNGFTKEANRSMT